MQPEIQKLLLDMLESARAIKSFVVGKTFDNFSTDDILRSGIYFKFVIIGEALSQLRLRDELLVGQITESHRIIGF